jgi:hypothetical protein
MHEEVRSLDSVAVCLGRFNYRNKQAPSQIADRLAE